jgi:hypothetical protein
MSRRSRGSPNPRLARQARSTTSPSAATRSPPGVLKRSFGVLAIAAVIVACSSPGAPLAPSASTVWEQGRYPSAATARPALSESTVSAPDLDRERLLLPIFDALSEQPGFQVGGLDPDPNVNGVVVYWKGEFGPGAQAVVEEAKRRRVVVDIVSVPYSFDELRKIAGRLVDALAAKGITLDGYQIGDPFDTITVWGSALDESADARRGAEDIAADLLPSDLKLAIVTSPGPVVPAVLETPS